MSGKSKKQARRELLIRIAACVLSLLMMGSMATLMLTFLLGR
jgi:hypothetical protein